MVDDNWTLLLSPITFGFAVATQLNVVFGGILEVKERFTGKLLQIAVVGGLVIDGMGLTVTVNNCWGPAQPLKDGVMV